MGLLARVAGARAVKVRKLNNNNNSSNSQISSTRLFHSEKCVSSFTAAVKVLCSAGSIAFECALIRSPAAFHLPPGCCLFNCRPQYVQVRWCAPPSLIGLFWMFNPLEQEQHLSRDWSHLDLRCIFGRSGQKCHSFYYTRALSLHRLPHQVKSRAV